MATAKQATRKAAANRTRTTPGSPAKTAAKQRPAKAAKTAGNAAKRASETAAAKNAKKTATKKTAAKKTASKATARKVARKTAGKASTKEASAKKTSRQPAGAAAKQPPAQKDWLVGELAPLRALAEAVVDLGVTVVDAAASRDGGAHLRSMYEENWPLGMLWSPPLWDACKRRVRTLRLWAEAEAMHDARGVAITPSFFVDPKQPERLWYAPSPEMPAALFVPLPATRAAIERALTELGPRTRPVELAEQRRVRAYMGAVATLRVPSPYSGELESAGPHELDRHFNFSPVVTPHAWGSAYADDPLLGQERMSTVAEIVALREMRAQTEGGIPRFTRRANFSRAHLAMEIHARGHYFWEIRYRPSPWTADVIAEFNALTGHQFPSDLPVDVAAAIHGFLYLDADWLAATLERETDPGQRAALTRAALGVAVDDLAEAARLARAAIARGGAEAFAVADAALQYNWQFLLEELGASTQDASLREQIEAFVIEGLDPPPIDEHGEPTDVYDVTGDDEDDDEDAADDDAEEDDDA